MACETLSRSILKTLSYRLCGTLATVGVVWFFSDDFRLAVTVGGVDALAKMALYFIHERLWQRIKLGERGSSERTMNLSESFDAVAAVSPSSTEPTR